MLTVQHPFTAAPCFWRESLWFMNFLSIALIGIIPWQRILFQAFQHKPSKDEPIQITKKFALRGENQLQSMENFYFSFSNSISFVISAYYFKLFWVYLNLCVVCKWICIESRINTGRQYEVKKVTAKRRMSAKWKK